jgi:hypothetical protein
MAQVKGIQIPLVVTYDKSAAEKAQTSLLSIDGVAAKLGKTLAGTFAAYKIEQFAASSVSAFLAEQKAVAMLQQSLTNLGQGYAAVQSNDFLNKLSEQTGIVKDQLLPAFNSLAIATKDAQKSQELLSLAVNISAGTGKDLNTVVSALGRAYNGSTTALSKLGAGLSQVALKSKNFSDIQARLTQMFKGDAAAAADTYQGKVNRLSAAFNEMKVSIGEGLVNAFSNLAGKNGSIDNAISAMNTFGNLTNYIFTHGSASVANWGSALANNPLIKFLYNNSGILKLSVTGWKEMAQTANLDAYNAKVKANTDALTSYYDNQKQQQAILAQYNAQSLADAKAQNKAAADKLALDKASAVLKQSNKTFDMQAIELAAASQDQLTAQDKARIQLKQDLLALDTAISEQNVAAATALAAQVNADQARVNSLSGTIANIPAVNDPFAGFGDYVNKALQYLTTLQGALASINSGMASLSAPTVPMSGNSATDSLLAQANAADAAAQAAAADAASYLNSSTYSGAITGTSTAQAPTINIYNSGSVVTSQDLASQVNDVIVNNTAQGLLNKLSRINTGAIA